MNNSKEQPTWCPGCGNYSILPSVKKALGELGLPPSRTVLVGDVGCSGKLPYWVEAQGLLGLHGRVIPLAEGVKLGNPNLTVLAVGGDGGVYGEGVNHLVSAARRNMDLTVIVHNNLVYGLTTGQYSPTSLKGFRTKSSLEGTFEPPLNGLLLSLVSGATFIARGFAGNLPHLSELIKKGVTHPGFALVEVLQPCVTFNKEQTFDYYRQRVYDLGATAHPTDNYYQALRKIQRWPLNHQLREETDELAGIPIGVFYEVMSPVFPIKPLVFPPVKLELNKILEAFD